MMMAHKTAIVVATTIAAAAAAAAAADTVMNDSGSLQLAGDLSFDP